MFEMTNTCEHHFHLIFIAIGNRKIVFYRAARLDDRIDAFEVCNFYTIGEREKRIAGHCRSVEIKTKTLRLVDSLLERIYSGRLAGSTCEELTVFC